MHRKCRRVTKGSWAEWGTRRGGARQVGRVVPIGLGLRRVILAVLVVVGMAGCSSIAGSDASFQFSSPGNADQIAYPVAKRGTIGDLTGPDLMGDGTIRLSDFAGKVVVLNFWGSWCPPCRAEAPELNAAASSLQSSGVQFLGVDIRDTRQAGRDFHSLSKTPYPSIFDPTMITLLSLRGFPTASIPSTIVLDRKHRVAHIWLRPVTRGELVSVITPIAAERD